jgi:D-3-phosphoglycerate dehydrogenase / 2-oxoglutarate reductase
MPAGVRYRALIAEPLDFSPEAVRILQTVADVDARACSRKELPQAFSEYEIVWFRLAYPITADVLTSRPRCRILATAVTGLSHIDLAACAQRGVRVISLRGETEFLKHVRATAELTLAISLALLRRIPETVASVQAGKWDRDAFRGRELFGKTVGIVGVGRLGSLAAGLFKAFGCDVLGYDPRPDFPDAVARRVSSLDELLGASDIVSIHVDYNSSTKGLIGAHELARMRPGAFLVNTARGGVLDEQALLQALKSGRLGGAALDVLDSEPDVSPDNPLIAFTRQSPRLLIVPHIGGNTAESFAKTEVFLARKIVQALDE